MPFRLRSCFHLHILLPIYRLSGGCRPYRHRVYADGSGAEETLSDVRHLGASIACSAIDLDCPVKTMYTGAGFSSATAICSLTLALHSGVARPYERGCCDRSSLCSWCFSSCMDSRALPHCLSGPSLAVFRGLLRGSGIATRGRTSQLGGAQAASGSLLLVSQPALGTHACGEFLHSRICLTSSLAYCIRQT